KLYSIAKLQRQRRKKNGVARTAKLHDGRLLQVRCAAARRGNLHGDANRARLREKLRQLLGATLFACECRTAVSHHLPHAPSIEVRLQGGIETHFTLQRTQTAV